MVVAVVVVVVGPTTQHSAGTGEAAPSAMSLWQAIGSRRPKTAPAASRSPSARQPAKPSSDANGQAAASGAEPSLEARSVGDAATGIGGTARAAAGVDRPQAARKPPAELDRVAQALAG